MYVNDLLQQKGTDVISIYELDSVAKAAGTLVDKNIGALIVLDESDQIVGILSERDLVYGLAYDASGRILDHHSPEIGVEQVCIDRLDATRYRIRLVTHERIMPAWEGIVDLEEGGPTTL